MTALGSPDPDIWDKKSPRPLVIGQLARGQYRVVSNRQLLELGFARKAIQHDLQTGHLYQLFRGVYAVGCPSVSWRGRVMGAVLACGSEAVASHQTAAALIGIRPTSRALIDVTTPRSRHGQRGIKVHRVRALDPEDRAMAGGIPVTSLARLLLDLAEAVTLRQLKRAFEEAEKRRLLDLNAIERLLDRSPGRHGAKPLRQVIAEYVEPPITQAELERLFIELCDLFGIPRPQTNVIVAGRVVDGVWHEQRVVIELDSRTHHMTTAAFEEDRRRDADLMLAGYRVLRITWRRLVDEPAAVAEIVRRLLAAG
jgi:very-short-patch-repair endonuclease